MQYRIFEIEYIYGSYSGQDKITISQDDIDRGINPIDRFWAEYRKQGLMTLGMATTSAKIIRHYLV